MNIYHFRAHIDLSFFSFKNTYYKKYRNASWGKDWLFPIIWLRLRERVWRKVEGFGNKLLSRAGKEILIKSVLQAIPTYAMGCFRLPDYLLSEIESIISRFWWGDGRHKRIHWMNWHTLCNSKRDGGMGFRDLRCFNDAMLGKQIWRILEFPDSLLSRVFKAKYFPNSDVLDVVPNGNSSFIWKSICSSLPLIRSGVRWRIGNDTGVDIWRDSWL